MRRVGTEQQSMNTGRVNHGSGFLKAKGYVSRLSARSALYTDLRLLLDGVREPMSSAGFHALAVGENRVARLSVSTRRKLWKELRARYILDISSPLFAAFWQEWVRCESEQERHLTAYVLFALNDRLVLDLGKDWLCPHLQRAPSEIRVEEVLTFIRQSITAHPEVAGWSEKTTDSVARHYMASIRDFGLARGKLRKFTICPALYGAPVRLLISALRLDGIKTKDLIHSSLFRILAIGEQAVIEALSELHRRRALRFKMQADVIELDLGGDS